MSRRLFLLIVLLGLGRVGSGQTAPKIQFEHLSVNEGLSENAVTAAIQDSRGFIWIGTHDGLNRYDGYSFIHYRNDPRNPNSLSDSAVSAICEDLSGRLWIGTSGGGLNRLDPITEIITRYRHDPNRPDSLGDDVILSTMRDRLGRIWISHGAGIDRFLPGDDRFVRMCPQTGWMFEDLAGTVWLLAGPDKLSRFDEPSGRFTPVPLPLPKNEKPSEVIILPCVNRSGTLLIVSATEIYRCRLAESRVLHEREPIRVPPGIRTMMASCAVECEDGGILIGTFGHGLIEIREGSRFHQLVHDPGDRYSLSNDNVVRLMEDRSGILWISTEGGGINLIKKDKTIFPLYQHIPGHTRCISGNYVTTIYKDAAGDLWIGTGGTGLNRINEETGTYRVYRHDPTRPNISLSHDFITSISAADTPDRLWIGTNNGLNRFNLRTETFHHVTHDETRPGSLSHNQIHNTFLDRRGGLWVIAYLYLDRLLPGRREFIHYRHDPGALDSISSGPGYPIYEDRNGTIWLGSWCSGLNRYVRESDTFRHYTHDEGRSDSLSHDRVWAIHEDRRGRMWIGTYGGGLNLLDRATGTFQRYVESDGLASNVVYGILEDRQGCLWMSTNNGLSRFNPETRTFRNFGLDNGLQSNEFNTRAFFKDSTGRMYFGGINGYNAFHPDSIRTNRHRPPVVITAITAAGRHLVPAGVQATGVLTLRHDENSVSFEFAALDYNSPAKNRYAYRLEGFESGWTRVGADRRFADYRNIPPGEYTFRVRGSNNDGIWNEAGCGLSILVQPPFWGTWWFRTAALVTFGVLFYLLVTFLKKHFDLIDFWRTRTIIGDYVVTEKIGSGGMGIVYKGTSRKDRSRIVALKVLDEEHSLNESLRRRFLNEGAIIDSLDHPHIVRVHQRDRHGNGLYIAMEFLEGRTLREKMDSEGSFSLTEAGDILTQLADVVAAIHEKGVIHRDLKPENIMLVRRDGRENYIKILDFGLAIMKNATRLTKSGMFMGTAGYTPPEQVARSDYGFPGDIYALGVVFYEMVTGESPFFGETSLEIIKQILNEDPVEPAAFQPDIPGEINALILRILDKDPLRRPTAEELKILLPQMFPESHCD